MRHKARRAQAFRKRIFETVGGALRAFNRSASFNSTKNKSKRDSRGTFRMRHFRQMCVILQTHIEIFLFVQAIKIISSKRIHFRVEIFKYFNAKYIETGVSLLGRRGNKSNKIKMEQ